MDMVTLVLLFTTFAFLITWSTKKTLLRYFGWDDRVFPAFSLFQHFNKGVTPNEFHGTERLLNWDVNLEKNSSVKPLPVSFHAFAIPLFGPVLRHGVGVFAQKAFASGEILERCPCLWVALPGGYAGYGGYDEGTRISPCSSKYSTQVLDHFLKWDQERLDPQSQVLLKEWEDSRGDSGMVKSVSAKFCAILQYEWN